MTLKYWNVCDQMVNETHLLIGGTTGSGKSTLLNSMLYTLTSKSDIGLILIDGKRGLELGEWATVPHCIGFAKDETDISSTLKMSEQMMMNRFDKMESLGQRKSTDPHIYIVIDEMAEVLVSKENTRIIERIMRLGRAANFHLIMATQAPNRAKGGGLTSYICQNITASVALRCKTNIESRQIIGIAGAEKLPLYGEALYSSPSKGIIKIEVPMTSDEDIEERINLWKPSTPKKRRWFSRCSDNDL